MVLFQLSSSTKFVTFEGKQWHSQCFRCFQCTKNISGEGFSIKNSKIVCARCVWLLLDISVISLTTWKYYIDSNSLSAKICYKYNSLVIYFIYVNIIWLCYNVFLLLMSQKFYFMHYKCKQLLELLSARLIMCEWIIHCDKFAVMKWHILAFFYSF